MEVVNAVQRTHCIFCNETLNTTFFEKDYECYVGHYMVDIDYDNKHAHKIPFNIHQCSNCKTVQTKYLGDLREIYKLNHADSTGTTMMELHEVTKNMILKYKEQIHNIIEIGSSMGILADKVLDEFETNYTIIEPCYWGNRDRKTVIRDFYENIDDSGLCSNTMIISHVFEHFYEPMKILTKMVENQNIEHFFLVFPDLEYYINHHALHVLNTEHTYYVDNDFLVHVLQSRGFKIIERQLHKNHSVLFYFQRDATMNITKEISFKNGNYSLDLFYKKIFDSVTHYNKIISANRTKNIYIWPASIHSLYLLIFGLHKNMKGFLDNSKHKIGKKLYGYELPIYSFDEIINENSENTIVIVNGGVFNAEIEKSIQLANHIMFCRV